MEYRPYYMAREWVRLGHRVHIVASARSHIRTEQPQLAGRRCLDETIDGIRYTWIETPVYAGNGVRRVVNMAAFVVRLFLEKNVTQSARPDLVIASSTYPMDIWPAHYIAKRAKAKLVFEVHDLWPLSPMELGGFSKWHPFMLLLQAAEDYACRHADAVVSILPKVADHMESRGLAPGKLHIVPNGIDPGEWSGDQPDLQGATGATLATLRAQGRFIIGYAGTHGVANALGTFVDAAKLMQDEQVAFVLAGGGPDKARLQQLARAARLRNVHFIAPIEKARVPALLRYFDVAYIGWRRQPLYRFGIAPNKLMDYMMAARPVLHAVEAGNDPVAEAGCGLTVAPENPQALARGVRALQALDHEQRAAMGQRGKTFVLEKLTYPVLSRRFLTACGVA